jgi:DNA repair protein SbcC/Rad50
MIPVRLMLEGFLSYQDPVIVDLSKIKVACVSGSNGAGKSTLFDAMTWSLFGKARRSDDGLIHNKSESCQVVFDFEYEGNRYRVDRTKPREKNTTLEFHVQTPAGDWKPFTEAGVRATEQRIQEILGLDYDTFVNASFFLQGKADMFSIQSPGKRKEILSNILGLTIWESYRNEAAIRRREAQKRLEIEQSILLEVNKELDEEDERKERLTSAQEILAMRAKLRESREKLLETAQLENARIKSDKEKMEMVSTQIDEIEGDLRATAQKLDARRTELQDFDQVLAQEEEIVRSYQTYLQARDRLTDLNSVSIQHNVLLVEKTELEGKIYSEKARLEQEQQNLLAAKAEISVLENQQQEISNDVRVMESESAQLQLEIDNIEKLEKELQHKKDLQSEKEAENNQFRVKMDEIKERMAHLQQSSGPDCPLCGQQLTAAHKEKILAKLEAEGTEHGNLFRENQATIINCKKDIERISAEINKLKLLRPRLAGLIGQANALSLQLEESARKIAAWEKESAPRLAVVADQLRKAIFSEGLQPKLEKISKSINALDYSAEDHAALREQELSLRQYEEKFHTLTQARTARAGLAREILELEDQTARFNKNLLQTKETLAALSMQIKQKEEKAGDPAQLEQELRQARLEENRARQDVGIAQQMVDVLDKQQKRKRELESQSQQYSRQIARLKMLEIAFGKDGVPALLIENAIPQIEIQANDILDKLSGGNMSVSFETERDFADKKREDRKQTLDIIIRDSAGSRAYELFSGGEAFRINFAIRLALSRVLAQRSGARLQTLVIDEGFGSQDEEGRQRLVEAINLVKGDFEKILVITHLDELKDAFSSRIEVSKTMQGSQVEVFA